MFQKQGRVEFLHQSRMAWTLRVIFIVMAIVIGEVRKTTARILIGTHSM